MCCLFFSFLSLILSKYLLSSLSSFSLFFNFLVLLFSISSLFSSSFSSPLGFISFLFSGTSSSSLLLLGFRLKIKGVFSFLTLLRGGTGGGCGDGGLILIFRP
ncbi:unnamed protein product [Meloidogyne enterolobii]|uniref:Uncharacterized protein n=1 Tax=Meloidogyne enterolobii TaxID=390850 RepID=A0ACB1B0Z4_MELEN